MNKIAIFASGGGTNAEAIMTHFKSSQTANVVLLLSNRASAYALERARNHSVPAIHFTKDTLTSDPAQIVDILHRHGVDFIVLAGFMCFMPREITSEWAGRIVNIHPALLPKFGGQGMYGDNVHKAVVAAGESESGITIHYVNEEYDKGDVIFQARCPLSPTDTPEDVAAKIHTLEQENYPNVVEIALMKLNQA